MRKMWLGWILNLWDSFVPRTLQSTLFSMHGWAQLIFKISGCMWLVWGQVTLGSALLSKTKLGSSCYFSPQFIFTITVKIIAVLAKVNSWVQHNQYINNIHHLHGIKPLPHNMFLRLHLRGKIENLYGKGSRKSAGILMDWVRVDIRSSAWPKHPRKRGWWQSCTWGIFRARWVVLPGLQKQNLPLPAGK